MSAENLFPLALTDAERAGRFDWHQHAASPRSSQALCVSALGSLRHEAFSTSRDEVLAALVGSAFPDWPPEAMTGWTIEIEKREPELLNELGGGTPSSLDALLTTSKAVVAVEAKFAADAAAGFGGCGQFHTSGKPRKCAGFHGHGSDLMPQTQGSGVVCRLTIPDGRRTPRGYWEFGRRWFRPEVFAEQTASEVCPFRDGHFQPMRNFLFAAESAARQGKEHFGVLVLCSNRCDGKLAGQVATFRDEILQEAHWSRVAMVHYERLIELLAAATTTAAHELAAFLRGRIANVLGT
jgi:hypothetical protein